MTQLSPAHARPEAWRRTPPALFPALLGLLGLGLAWRASGTALQSALARILPEDQVAGLADVMQRVWAGADVLLLMTCTLYLFCLASYLAKVSVRPKVLLEDMSSVPGRAGTAALTMGLMLFAAALLPLSETVAWAAFWLGLTLHLCIAGLALWLILRTPGGMRVTPVWHLNFVGYVLAPLSGIGLGYLDVSSLILVAALCCAALIYTISAVQLSQAPVPEPQRPLLAIHLAPVSLFTTVAMLLGWQRLALVAGIFAVGLFAVLLSRAGYLMKSGFSPLWGAFTFPLAALAVALFALGGQIPELGLLGLVPLALASLLTPVVAIRVLLMWVRGTLALKTGAAIA